MDSKETIHYRNRRYGFTLNIPAWWKNHCYINDENILEDAEASINFYLKYTRTYKGRNHTIVFSIVIFHMSKEEWLENYKESPFQFIACHNGRVFAAISPEEPPEEFYNEKKGDYDRSLQEFKWLFEMENDEVPSIIQTLRFS